MLRWLFGSAVAAVCWGAIGTASAFAHAPLARAVAVGREGAAIALRMPGFGLLVRAPGDERFAYACDALLGWTPEDMQAPFAYLAGGELLVGTAHGLRAFTPSGCPAAESVRLADVPIAAIAVHPGHSARVYAVSAELTPGLYRSEDGGASFALRGRLQAGTPVSALLLDPRDPEVVLVSQQGALLARSEDGGASFQRFPQERELVLLRAAAGDPARLWAMARTRGVRGADILRADRIEGPFEPALHVNFFGGFAVDEATGALWAGDEGGGLFRSSDGGDSWEEVAPDLAVACLAQANGAVWACTPGLPAQRALATMARETTDAQDVVAFTDVDRLTDCAPELATDVLCAAAWNEWRADVLGVMSGAGAAGSGGAAGSAGAGASASASGGTDAAETADLAAPPATANGCRVAPRVGAPASSLLPVAIALLIAAATARRRSASRAPRPGARRPA